MTQRKPYLFVNDLPALQNRIVALLERYGSLDIVEIVHQLSTSPRQVQSSLHALVSAGRVVCDDGEPFRVYRVVADG